MYERVYPCLCMRCMGERVYPHPYVCMCEFVYCMYVCMYMCMYVCRCKKIPGIVSIERSSHQNTIVIKPLQSSGQDLTKSLH